MEKKVKSRILAIIIFIGIISIVVIASDYIATYYKNHGRDVPKWVYYSALILSGAGLGFAYSTFMKAFTTEKGNRKSNE